MRIMQQFFYIVTSEWKFFNMFLYKTYKHKAHAAAGASGKSEGKKNRSCERCFHLEMVGCRVRCRLWGLDGRRVEALSRSALPL